MPANAASPQRRAINPCGVIQRSSAWARSTLSCSTFRALVTKRATARLAAGISGAASATHSTPAAASVRPAMSSSFTAPRHPNSDAGRVNPGRQELVANLGRHEAERLRIPLPVVGGHAVAADLLDDRTDGDVLEVVIHEAETRQPADHLLTPLGHADVHQHV